MDPVLRSLHIVVLALAGAALPLGLAAPDAASAKAPRDFVGLVSEDVFAGDAAYRSANLSPQAAAGVGVLRQTFDWSQIETSPEHYDLSIYDAYVAAAAAHRIRILPILFNPPPFRSSRPARGARRGTYPPKRFADLGKLGAALVRRYGPKGTLWRERPDVPKLPIRAWQIWNEPNLPAYWPTGPSPRRYTALLRAAARAIKRVDRRAEIVTAGVPDSRMSKPLPYLRYIAGMYRAGARSAFDTLAINPYARNDRDLLKKLTAVRRLMNRNRDRRARIWATEIGWSDVGPPSPFRVGAAGQARRIARSLPLLARRRKRLGLRGFVYYSWRDSPPYAPSFTDFWGLHTGLRDINGEPKPAFFAFERAVGKLR